MKQSFTHIYIMISTAILTFGAFMAAHHGLNSVRTSPPSSSSAAITAPSSTDFTTSSMQSESPLSTTDAGLQSRSRQRPSTRQPVLKRHGLMTSLTSSTTDTHTSDPHEITWSVSTEPRLSTWSGGMHSPWLRIEAPAVQPLFLYVAYERSFVRFFHHDGGTVWVPVREHGQIDVYAFELTEHDISPDKALWHLELLLTEGGQ